MYIYDTIKNFFQNLRPHFQNNFVPAFLCFFCARLRNVTQKAIENQTPVYFCLHYEIYKFFIHFLSFLLLCGLVSYIFTI